MRIGCVVKAAGESRRFGGNKLLAELAGRPVLEYVLESLPRERFAALAAVVSDAAVERLCRAVGIQTVPGTGTLSGNIRAGLAAVGEVDGCLFVNGDQPLCGAASYRRLLDAFEAAPERVCRLAFEGTAGAPVLFPWRLFPRLRTLTGEAGGLAAAGGEDIALVSADLPEELWDVDTPQALEMAFSFFRTHREMGR